MQARDVLSLHLGDQVPFGKKTAFICVEPDFLKDIKSQFEVLINNYQDIGGDGIQRLNKWPHMFTINVSPTYWFLYGTRVQNSPVCVAVDREHKRQYVFNANFQSAFYDGTLITGEIVGHTFIAQDLLISRGERRFYQKHSLPIRLGKLKHLLCHSFSPDTLLDPLNFCVRPYFDLNNLNRINDINELVAKFGEPKFKHLVFTPLQFPFYPNSIIYRLKQNDLKCNSLFVPPQSKALQTLRLTKSPVDGPDVYKLSSSLGADLGLALVSSENTSQRLREILKDRDSIELPCSFNNEFRKWQPILS